MLVDFLFRFIISVICVYVLVHIFNNYLILKFDASLTHTKIVIQNVRWSVWFTSDIPAPFSSIKLFQKKQKIISLTQLLLKNSAFTWTTFPHRLHSLSRKSIYGRHINHFWFSIIMSSTYFPTSFQQKRKILN